MDKEIIIKPNFVFKDYLKVNLGLLFFKPTTLIIALLLVTFLIAIPIFGTVLLAELSFSSFAFIAVLILYLIMIPILTYYNTKKSLDNPRIKEDITYIFNTEYFEEKGDSFQMKHFWKNFKKIEEKRNWFLVHLQKRRALVVRKEDLGSKLSDFKELLKSIDIKKKLK